MATREQIEEALSKSDDARLIQCAQAGAMDINDLMKWPHDEKCQRLLYKIHDSKDVPSERKNAMIKFLGLKTDAEQQRIATEKAIEIAVRSERTANRAITWAKLSVGISLIGALLNGLVTQCLMQHRP